MTTRQRTWSAGEVESAITGYFTHDLMEKNFVVQEVVEALRECQITFPEYTPPRYPSKVTPTRQSDDYGCAPGCWPSRLAFLLHRLPWQGMLTVKAEPKNFLDLFSGWSDLFGPGRWWDVMDVLRPVGSPFWLITFVDGPSGKTDHAHILIGGGLSEFSIVRAVKGWPYSRLVDFSPVVMSRGGPWGLLHYVLSQQGRQPHVHVYHRSGRAPLRRPDSYPMAWEILSPGAPPIQARRSPTMPSDWEDYHRALEDERTPDDWAHVGHWGDRFSYCHNISRPPV